MRELISYLDLSRVSLRHWPVIESTPSTPVQAGVPLQCNGGNVKPSLARFTYSTSPSKTLLVNSLHRRMSYRSSTRCGCLGLLKGLELFLCPLPQSPRQLLVLRDDCLLIRDANGLIVLATLDIRRRRGPKVVPHANSGGYTKNRGDGSSDSEQEAFLLQPASHSRDDSARVHSDHLDLRMPLCEFPSEADDSHLALAVALIVRLQWYVSKLCPILRLARVKRPTISSEGPFSLSNKMPPFAAFRLC